MPGGRGVFSDPAPRNSGLLFENKSMTKRTLSEFKSATIFRVRKDGSITNLRGALLAI